MLASSFRRLLYSTRYMMSNSVKDLKVARRRQIKSILNALSPASVHEQSVSIAQKVFQLEEYRAATTLSIFLSMPNKEISTRDIVLQAFRDGKHVFVPFIYSATNSNLKFMDMLRLQDEDDLNSLQPDAWGIPSIASESVPSRENALGGLGLSQDTQDPDYGSSALDVIFMPAMAFDRSCHRLGHGRGFYDRYLAQYNDLAKSRKQSRCVPHLVGLALKEQILPDGEQLPATNQDWKVDRVISMEKCFPDDP